MKCQCKAKLRTLLAKVASNDELMADAATEGPYWERKVVSGFIRRLRERPESVDCKCPVAQRINIAFAHVQNPAVGTAVAHSGGGTMKDRLDQNFSYAEFKRLLTGEAQKVKPVVAIPI
ncbi:MAG: hypothetical protein UV50_C0024G0003 [Parcubacteria group bacterium GW2011_GWB1_42_9]|nr:MAG: hypothetical protein UV50_C0024G0003 [Parcubacteria group bacterium GW2011_GWB1_42_9]